MIPSETWICFFNLKTYRIGPLEIHLIYKKVRAKDTAGQINREEKLTGIKKKRRKIQEPICKIRKTEKENYNLCEINKNKKVELELQNLTRWSREAQSWKTEQIVAGKVSYGIKAGSSCKHIEGIK